MKFVKVEFLAVVLLLFSCTEEPETLSVPPLATYATPSITLAKSSASSDVKNQLYAFAHETITGLYPVNFTPQGTQLLTKPALANWIKKNEKNKSAKINKENQRLLSKVLQQATVNAILVNISKGKDFQQAVYVLIPKKYRVSDFASVGAVLITDAVTSASDSDDDGDSPGGGDGGGDDGGTGGGDDDDGDDDDDEETGQTCYTQSGTHLDATQSQTSDNPLSGCPPCVVECVECSSGLAGQDNCVNCSV